MNIPAIVQACATGGYPLGYTDGKITVQGKSGANAPKLPDDLLAILKPYRQAVVDYLRTGAERDLKPEEMQAVVANEPVQACAFCKNVASYLHKDGSWYCEFCVTFNYGAAIWDMSYRRESPPFHQSKDLTDAVIRLNVVREHIAERCRDARMAMRNQDTVEFKRILADIQHIRHFEHETAYRTWRFLYDKERTAEPVLIG